MDMLDSNDSKSLRILRLISELRGSHPNMEYLFLNGACMNLFYILRTIYQEAEPWYNMSHIITKIDDSFYDITGKILDVSEYRPFVDFYNKRRTSRAMSQMYRYTNPKVTLI